METELVPGAKIRFSFGPDDPGVDPELNTGEILAVDPPRLFAFRWGDSELRFELTRDGSGCLLSFSHTLGGKPPMGDRLAAARQAAGWDTCLETLAARLDGRAVDPAAADWFPLVERYLEKFGLAWGEVVHQVRFERDFVQPAEQVWAALVEGGDPPAVGGEPPARATNAYVQAGPVTTAEPDRVLEYGTADGGQLRWEIVPGPWGCRVVLTQTVPARLADRLPTVLAAWHVHLELFFAAVNGHPRPWPEARTEELTMAYTARR
jgi:uncharacterized protein YndB with AHSA1/START domain